MTTDEKISVYCCIKKQFPDAGLYRVSRVTEWLGTNGISPKELGFASFAELAEEMPEVFSRQEDNNSVFIEVKIWPTGDNSMVYNTSNTHPADGFFGKLNDITLNDDIIELSVSMLYALTKNLGNGLSTQEMKQEIYRKFEDAKRNGKLSFLSEKYSFPIGCCPDGMIINGIITKNTASYGKSLYFAFEKTNIYDPDFVPAQAEPAAAAISAEDSARIYELLVRSFPCEMPIPMASLSKPLQDHGITPIRFGFGKMKELLSQLEFLTLVDVNRGGGQQSDVIIHLNRGIKPEPQPREEPQLREPQVVSERPIYGKPDSWQHAKSAPAYPEPFADDHRFDAPKERADEQRTAHPDNIPAGRLEDFCNLPQKPITILMNYLEKNGIRADYFSIKDTLSEDFDIARDRGNIRGFEQKLIFPCRYRKEDGSNVEITIKPSAYEGKPWFLFFVDTTVRDRSTTEVVPGKQLESFAFLGSWQSFLLELAEKAVHEEWDFPGSSKKNYCILMQYIKYTFSRLTREGKVCISSDGRFSAFNTGLVDNRYDDIYVCFTPNAHENEGSDGRENAPWKFAGFCTAASGGLGKQLVNCFNPLPQPPSYFKRKEDLFFDHTKQLHTDFEHIIIDNIKRLPTQFLYDQFSDNPPARELIETINSTDDYIVRANCYEKLKAIILENNRLFMRIQNRIKDSIEFARKRVRWNYKTAVPSYFPKRDSMSLMLPLGLMDEEKPDVALVVELTRSGSYQGQTILTMPQAYIDARLMCRLAGDDWLSRTNIMPDTICSRDDEPI